MMNTTPTSKQKLPAKRKLLRPGPSAQRAAIGKRNGYPSPGSSPAGQALTVTVRLPLETALDEATAQRLLTLTLVSSGHLSQSQGAQMLDISRSAFLELMGAHSLPIVRLSAEESALQNRHLRELQALRKPANGEPVKGNSAKGNRPKAASGAARP